jgi:hypothetical protein
VTQIGETLTYRDRLDHSAVLHAAELVHRLVARPEVAAAWTRESSCAGLNVGGLTRHLVEQSLYVVRLVGPGAVPRADAGTNSLLEHYARSEWLHEDLDAESNRFVVVKSEGQATEGPQAAVDLQAGAVADLPNVLAQAPDQMYLPWQDARMATDDFLVTRLMEMVVHSDDLATSVGVSSPEFGGAVLEPVLGLLTALAVVRHGQDAVVRALARPQRAPASIAVF